MSRRHFHVALLALPLAALASPTPRASPSPTPRSIGPQCWYNASFPPESAWLPFSALFTQWTPVFASQNDTAAEIGTLRTALTTYAAQAGFSAAFATALVVQESAGNTCAPCGDGGASCGVMQVQGAGVPRGCAGAAHPCAAETVARMVQCGCVGCDGATGSNVRECLARYGGAYGPAARCYNSGSVEDGADLRRAGAGDARYVQNIANILLGADYAALYALDGSRCGF